MASMAAVEPEPEPEPEPEVAVLEAALDVAAEKYTAGWLTAYSKLDLAAIKSLAETNPEAAVVGDSAAEAAPVPVEQDSV